MRLAAWRSAIISSFIANVLPLGSLVRRVLLQSGPVWLEPRD
jgi:hypothetical protein